MINHDRLNLSLSSWLCYSFRLAKTVHYRLHAQYQISQCQPVMYLKKQKQTQKHACIGLHRHLVDSQSKWHLTDGNTHHNHKTLKTQFIFLSRYGNKKRPSADPLRNETSLHSTAVCSSGYRDSCGRNLMNSQIENSKSLDSKVQI